MLLQLQTWPLPEHKHRCDSTTSSISLFFLLHHHFFPPLLPPHLPPTIFLTPDSPPSHLLTLLFLFASLPVSAVIELGCGNSVSSHPSWVPSTDAPEVVPLADWNCAPGCLCWISET
ncbi:uncharacterized protein [Physcomitrium patens]|uniref:uncharacterized protein isoform X2 n=1 Tax=Physcomitrium patens TaxID=3218 RepID=UPI003CCD8CC4